MEALQSNYLCNANLSNQQKKFFRNKISYRDSVNLKFFQSVKCLTPTRAALAETDNSTLKKGIAEFYDESSGLWEDMWGEHMHHGYYEPGVKNVNHRQAQVDMIHKSLEWAGVTVENPPKRIVDVGCGIGGSARHLSRMFGANVKGITLSPVQAQRGNEICREQGLSDKVEILVADALQQPFPDNSFDFVWSMESGEHMPNKPKFIGELNRVVAPGGRILVVTWCHRNLEVNETKLKPDEEDLLKKICDAYFLPAWCSGNDYVKIMEETGLKEVRVDDWTEYVTPFWPAVIQTALTLRGILGVIKSGLTTLKGAIAMAFMVQGFSKGLIKFVIITAEKPLE